MNKHISAEVSTPTKHRGAPFKSNEATLAEPFEPETPVTPTARGQTADSDGDSPQMLYVRNDAEWTLEYLLLGDLADLLSEGYDEENRKWMLVVLEGLLDAIPAERRSERFRRLREAYPDSPGMLVSLLQLEAEQDAMIFQLQRLRNRVAWRLSLLDVVAAEVVLDLKRWLMTFQSFCQREHRLVNFEEVDTSGSPNGR